MHTYNLKKYIYLCSSVVTVTVTSIEFLPTTKSHVSSLSTQISVSNTVPINMKQDSYRIVDSIIWEQETLCWVWNIRLLPETRDPRGQMTKGITWGSCPWTGLNLSIQKELIITKTINCNKLKMLKAMISYWCWKKNVNWKWQKFSCHSK